MIGLAPRSRLLIAVLVPALALGTSLLASPQQSGGTTRVPGQPPAVAATPGPRKIVPNNLLQIDVAGEKDLSRVYVVQPDGAIVFPLVRPIAVVGLTTEEVAVNIRAALVSSKALVNPRVSVELTTPHPSVFVTGAVHQAGEYALPIRDLTLQHALAEARGVSSMAAATLEIRRPGAKSARGVATADATVIQVSRKDLDEGRADPALQDGDVIFVPTAPMVTVLGAVRQPGLIAWQQGMTISSAIQRAGAFAESAWRSQVSVTRGGETIGPFDAGTQAKTPLQRDDVINVPQETTHSIYVLGDVRVAGAFSLPTDQLTVLDAIGLAGGMNSTAFSTVQIRRPTPGATAGPAASGQTFAVNLHDIEAGRVANPALVEGDTVYVPTAPLVYVNGFVRLPGHVMWREGLTVADAILASGGFGLEAARGSVKITRVSGGKQESRTLSEKAQATMVLQPEDQIEVPRKKF